MIVSNEPGYYEENNFGVRIENLLIVVKKDALGEYRGRSFLGFERLTHIPIQKKLMDVSLLTDPEIAWINDYHNSIRVKVMPLLRTESARKWLIESTDRISPNPK